MLLIFDLDTSELIESRGNRAPISALRAPRNDGVQVRVQFVRAGVPEQLGGTPEIVFVVKAPGEWTTEAAATATFTWDATAQLYAGVISLATDPLNALFGASPEATSVTVNAQLGYRIAAGVYELSQTVPMTIANSVVRDTPLIPPAPVPDGVTITEGGYMQITLGGETYHLVAAEGEAPA